MVPTGLPQILCKFGTNHVGQCHQGAGPQLPLDQRFVVVYEAQKLWNKLRYALLP